MTSGRRYDRRAKLYWQRAEAMEAQRYSRMHESAERVALRRWLRQHDIEPVMGTEPSHTERLMKQVFKAGGDPSALMKAACAEVDAKRERG